MASQSQSQPKVGLETRSNILPVPAIPDKVPGIFGPDFSFADQIPLPGQVGVRNGDSFGDVLDSVKAVAFYADTIGFGEPSSFLTRGMPLKPLGVNTWLRTGMKCSNGADMWMYQQGIPTGNALGKRMADGLESAGLPRLRGLAPGILEDVQEALNPAPVLSAVFGSGYPSCRFEEKPVGDQDGKIQNPATKAYYVENPQTVKQKDGRAVQGRWVQDAMLTKDQWEKTPKTHCPDGYPIKNHKDGKCENPLISMSMEGFTDGQAAWTAGLLAAAALGTLLLLRARA
jgi:hypothetical protein